MTGAPADPTDDWRDADALAGQQGAVGSLRPAPWEPPRAPLRVAGCFVAFARWEEGPGAAGDHALVGAAVVGEPGDLLGGVVVPGVADGPYRPGLLALREGRMSAAALARLFERHGRPDVLMVDATGRDHPRRCGLALHLGWLLDVPSVGVTHRLLGGEDRDPPDLRRRGDTAVVRARGDEVAAWLCTRDDVRPVAVHAGWRTDAASAVDVTLRTTVAARTPEPLRLARRLAREARSEGALRPGPGSR